MRLSTPRYLLRFASPPLTPWFHVLSTLCLSRPLSTSLCACACFTMLMFSFLLSACWQRCFIVSRKPQWLPRSKVRPALIRAFEKAQRFAACFSLFPNPCLTAHLLMFMNALFGFTYLALSLLMILVCVRAHQNHMCACARACVRVCACVCACEQSESFTDSSKGLRAALMPMTAWMMTAL